MIYQRIVVQLFSFWKEVWIVQSLFRSLRSIWSSKNASFHAAKNCRFYYKQVRCDRRADDQRNRQRTSNQQTTTKKLYKHFNNKTFSSSRVELFLSSFPSFVLSVFLFFSSDCREMVFCLSSSSFCHFITLKLHQLVQERNKRNNKSLNIFSKHSNVIFCAAVNVQVLN